MTAHDPELALILIDGYCAVTDRAYSVGAFGSILSDVNPTFKYATVAGTGNNHGPWLESFST